MRTTKTMKSISNMCKELQVDEAKVYHQSKLLLNIYRDVVWKTWKEATYLREACEDYCSHNLNLALTYLSDFAPTEEKEQFKNRVSCMFETAWMIELVDIAMAKIYDYPGKGQIYHEILSKCYLNMSHISEQELFECLSMERTSFYERKKEGIALFGVVLWGYAIPHYSNRFQLANNSSDDYGQYVFSGMEHFMLKDYGASN